MNTSIKLCCFGGVLGVIAFLCVIVGFILSGKIKEDGVSMGLGLKSSPVKKQLRIVTGISTSCTALFFITMFALLLVCSVRASSDTVTDFTVTRSYQSKSSMFGSGTYTTVVYYAGEEYAVKESSITVADSDALVRYYNTDGKYIGNKLYLSRESAKELGIYSELKH